MSTINPYINFNGDTEEAFNFYKSVFGGEFASLSRYKDTPEAGKMDPAEQNKIMHIALPIGKGNILMGTDVLESRGDRVTQGNNFHLTVHTESKDEADKIFGKLSKEGKITLPMSDMFWGDYFGMITDRFGVQWMVTFNKSQNN